MSATFIRRVIEVTIAIFAIAALHKFGRALVSILNGEFGTLLWPVQAGAYELDARLGDGAVTHFIDGTLAVSDQPIWHGVDVAFSLGGLALILAALFALRKVLVGFAGGELMNAENAGALRKIGKILLLACGLSVLHAVVIQSAILSAVTPVEGTMLHPSISWDVSGMTNIWLHYSPPLVTFTLGGLALLFAEAFKAGNAYREDSESVV